MRFFLCHSSPPWEGSPVQVEPWCGTRCTKWFPGRIWRRYRLGRLGRFGRMTVSEWATEWLTAWGYICYGVKLWCFCRFVVLLFCVFLIKKNTLIVLCSFDNKFIIHYNLEPELCYINISIFIIIQYTCRKTIGILESWLGSSVKIQNQIIINHYYIYF